MEADTDRHLRRAAAGREDRIEDNVARDGHRVRKVTVDLVQYVFRRPAQQNRARFGSCALRQECEVLVAYLLDVEQPALRADVRLAQIFHTVHDRGANSACDAVVVGFPYSSQCRHIRLVEEVLRVVW